ncbi:hypothetical protein Clacol_003640 [Clathrus columnatus]|uniref:Asparagine synthetase domain-containing protein n=1 Tax=Clathrus columnatus TaxID=1419009 RepID=A0AAV5A9T7_9AGAM|nr:hypothetical protein Clacol_003640 [Clathrus columnatus]
MTELSEDLSNAMDKLFHVLDKSVEEQVKSIPPPATPDNSRVAVLFSGGIDSTIIAFLADRHVPPAEPIDLLNVAFENPRRVRTDIPRNKRKLNMNKTTYTVLKEGIYNVPDRISGLEELEELRRLCPNRRWNFAKDIVQRIMYPSKTVMDLSLGLALYFASKGTGVIKNFDQDVPYISPAKVLLNGLGSDELLGGYGRHRSAFNRGGWSELVKELQLELDRLPSRNLGRDDRIISHHGKETRHPFLSLSVVNSLSQLSVHLKTDPRLDIGLGDKMLLRLLTKKLGLELASSRKKKAMQFGTCSARMENGISGGDGEKPLYEE